jgi:hypothetical protein
MGQGTKRQAMGDVQTVRIPVGRKSLKERMQTCRNKTVHHHRWTGGTNTMNEKQIKYMTEQFLRWKLPENFNPDGGISFEPVGNKGTPHQFKREPTGTNLFDYNQAEAMVRHMIKGLLP